MPEYVLCVDQGGTKTNIARGDKNGEIQDIRRFIIDLSDHAIVVKQIFDAIDVYLRENCIRLGSPLRIGMGVKGYADREKGIWKRCITIPNFTPVNLGEMAYDKFGINAVIDNDVHAATLAELYYGAGKQYKNYIYYNIGTGIAIGIVSEGKLIRGSTNYSGEIGHMVTETEGDLCPCGHFGCLEGVASGAAIIEQVRRGLSEYPQSGMHNINSNGTLTSHTVFKMAEEGDVLAGLVTNRALRSIQLSVISILNIFNPEAIIFGGGVMADGLLLPKIKEYAYKYSLRPSAWALKEVCLSKLGANRVGILGAAAIGWEDSI